VILLDVVLRQYVIVLLAADGSDIAGAERSAQERNEYPEGQMRQRFASLVGGLLGFSEDFFYAFVRVSFAIRCADWRR
jgi:hypothetical protein